jgi:hypothetical protein
MYWILEVERTMTTQNIQGNSMRPTDFVDELIRRGRNVPFDTKFPGKTDEQLLTALEVYFVNQAQRPNLLPSHGTTIACTKCGRLEAPGYYLKRSHGRYAVLCFDNGAGCWEHSSRANCSYVDQHSAQCMELAEWAVAYGPDLLKQRSVCALHVPAVLSDASEHRIYPLED